MLSPAFDTEYAEAVGTLNWITRSMSAIPVVMLIIFLMDDLRTRGKKAVIVFIMPITLILKDLTKSADTETKSFSLVLISFQGSKKVNFGLVPYASCKVVKPLSSLTYAALLMSTSSVPPVSLAVSVAAIWRACTSTISASKTCRFPFSPSFAMRSSVAFLLRTKPMTILDGFSDKCLMNAYLEGN
jgi:hypothetical protein